MMEWFPTVAFTFKILVLGIGMFFAVKWHYDQGRKGKGKEMDMRAVLLAGGKATALFMLLLLCLGLFTFFLMRTFGLESMMAIP